MNRFHEAAREGHLDLLRDATRRDANKPDDTGRTPPMWAAYEGKIDALRLLISRGYVHLLHRVFTNYLLPA